MHLGGGVVPIFARSSVRSLFPFPFPPSYSSWAELLCVTYSLVYHLPQGLLYIPSSSHQKLIYVTVCWWPHTQQKWRNKSLEAGQVRGNFLLLKEACRVVEHHKKSHSTLRAKWATFIFWVAKSVLKMPNMFNVGEFLKTWSLRSNSVTRQVNFNWTNIGGKWQN